MILHVPSAFANVVPTAKLVLKSIRVTKLPASAVPVTVGVRTLVMRSVFDVPLSLLGLSVTPLGAAGAWVSTGKLKRPWLFALPALSVKLPGTTSIIALPLKLAAGVKVAR